MSTWATQNRSVREPRTPDSLRQENVRPLRRGPNVSIDEWMKGLLLDKDDELPPSARGKLDRVQRAEERKRRERADALRKAKELRLSRRRPVKPLVQPLNTEWEGLVYDAEHTNSQYQVITTAMEGTELRLKDFRTLLGRHAWLNDEIINSYIEWIVQAANEDAAATDQALGEPASTVPKFIAHNSFFY